MLPRHPSHPRHPRHPRPVQGIWILLACIVVFIGALAIYHFYLMAVWGVLQWYLIAFFGLLGLIAGISYSIRRTHYFHLHHYFIFGYTTATPPPAVAHAVIGLLEIGVAVIAAPLLPRTLVPF